MPKTLLLADDSVTIQKVVGLSFAAEDVTVIAVDNGDDAIARAREERPDVILADVVMPGKNGYEVCEAIKADPALAHIPVLLLTGTFEAFDEERAQSVGAAGHIAKPFQAQALVDEVRRLFDSHPPAAQSSPPDPVEEEKSNSMDDDAFDFFDDEPATSASDPLNMGNDSGENDQALSDDSLFEFGNDSFSSLETPASPAESMEPAGEPITAVPEERDMIEEVVATAADAEVEQASLTSAEALLESERNPEDSLAPSSSASSDEPFDFALDEPASEPSIDIDPLEGIDPLDSVDVEDLAQATILDPRGASGYDVSSSDLGPAPEFDSTPEPAPSENRPWAATHEPDATVLAPEFQVEDASDSDFLKAELVGPDPQSTELASSSQIEVEVEAVAPSEISEPAAAGEPLAAPEPSDPPRSLPPEAAAQAESVLDAIEPQLREQLHDTLEKIAWESMGSLTEQIVQQAVERVETIAWEVVPKLAETLIQEEIRRMKGTPPNDE